MLHKGYLRPNQLLWLMRKLLVCIIEENTFVWQIICNAKENIAEKIIDFHTKTQLQSPSLFLLSREQVNS